MKPESRYIALCLLLLIVSSVFGQSNDSKESASWQKGFDLFAEEFDKAVKEGAKSDSLKTLFVGKSVRWKLTLKGVEKTKDGTTIEFDLEPHGILKKAFDSKRSFWAKFTPLASSLSDWEKIKSGSPVLFEGTIRDAFPFTMGDKKWAMVTVSDLKPLDDEKK